MRTMAVSRAGDRELLDTQRMRKTLENMSPIKYELDFPIRKRKPKSTCISKIGKPKNLR